MNALLKKASLAIATASLPITACATPKDNNTPWPPSPTSKDWVFIPPLNSIAESDATQALDSVVISTPVPIGQECVLTPSYQIFSVIENPTERAQHQKLIDEWAHANEEELIKFASALSTASFSAVGKYHSTSAICQNNPEVRETLRQAFTQSTALFTQGLNEIFPKVIKDGTGIHFSITGFIKAPVHIDPASIA